MSTLTGADQTREVLIMTLAEVKGELINIVLRIAIAEDKPGVKDSIITGWKISEARLQNYLRMKTNVYSKE